MYHKSYLTAQQTTEIRTVARSLPLFFILR